MAFPTGHKLTLALGTTLGTATPGLLAQFADNALASGQKSAGTIKELEAYPLWMRPSLLVGYGTGIPALLLGMWGDKLIKDMSEKLQLGLLSYGVASTVATTIELGRALSARNAIGIPVFFPKGTDVAKTGTTAQRATAYYVDPKVVVVPPSAPGAPGGSVPTNGQIL